MKLKTLEQFESNKPCKCGGNCGCGKKSVNEKFSFSKKEVESAASLIASAIAQADKVKTKVHHLEYDKGRGAGFDISIDGEESAGGSYVVKDNGDVVNAAIGNSHPNAVYSTIGNKDIADVFTNMEKYESVVTEAKFKIGDRVSVLGKKSKKPFDSGEVTGIQKDGTILINGLETISHEVAIDADLVVKESAVTEDNIDEAKKYKFKDLAKAWSHVYGEDMEDEYEGFFQEVVGKYKNKVTKKDIANIWLAVYGEDIADDYDGFYNELQENLNQVAKLEELFSDEIDEANSDGTISDDEDERMEDLLGTVEAEIDDLISKARDGAYDIGGNFRGPGNASQLKKLMLGKIKKMKH